MFATLFPPRSISGCPGPRTKKNPPAARSRFRFALAIALAAPAPAALAQSSTPAPAAVSATYVISVAGTIVADVRIRLADDGQNYSLDLDANVAGLGNLVARGSATINASGTSSGSGLQGKDFQLKTRSSEGGASAMVQFSQGNVSAFIVDPPLVPRIDQIPLERAHLRSVNDMLSAFVLKGGRFDRSLCERKLRIFTGVERFDLDMRFAASETATSARTGYQGPVILCQLRYTPVSGHYASSEITNYLKNSDRILIWYAPVARTSLFIPYRVLIGTSFGDLSMVLTRLE